MFPIEVDLMLDASEVGLVKGTVSLFDSNGEIDEC